MTEIMSARDRWEQAEPLDRYVARTNENHDLWQMTHKRATVNAAATIRAAQLTGSWYVLVLVEDWCGDAVNSVPVLQRIADANPDIELRVLERDQHLDLMDTHLSDGARAIPMAIVYDAEFAERGHWGSRPAPLQAWVTETGRHMEKEERYKQVRTWYVRDRGVTIADEFLSLLEQAARESGNSAAVAGANQVAGSSPL